MYTIRIQYILYTSNMHIHNIIGVNTEKLVRIGLAVYTCMYKNTQNMMYSMCIYLPRIL